MTNKGTSSDECGVIGPHGEALVLRLQQDEEEPPSVLGRDDDAHGCEAVG